MLELDGFDCGEHAVIVVTHPDYELVHSLVLDLVATEIQVFDGRPEVAHQIDRTRLANVVAAEQELLASVVTHSLTHGHPVTFSHLVSHSVQDFTVAMPPHQSLRVW